MPHGAASLRLALPADAEAIEALRSASIRAIFPAFYDARQTASSLAHVGRVDQALIADGTYYVVEADAALVACGGWSRREKSYAGSSEQAPARLLDPASEPARVRAMFVSDRWTRRGLGSRILQACEAAAGRDGYRALALMATLPGIPLYEHFGFRVVRRVSVPLPDGVELPCVEMLKDLATSDDGR